MIPIIDERCIGYYVGIAADMAARTPWLIAQPKLVSIIPTDYALLWCLTPSFFDGTLHHK